MIESKENVRAGPIDLGGPIKLTVQSIDIIKKEKKTAMFLSNRHAQLIDRSGSMYVKPSLLLAELVPIRLPVV